MSLNKIQGPVAQPSQQDILNSIMRQVTTSINCVQVGTIQSYDASKNTVTATINFKTELVDGRILDYPLLVDCPVFFLTGGDSYISVPIQKGDTCIVLFNDRDLDNWWYDGSITTPSSSRFHSLADGMCLVGVRNQANKITLKSNIVEVFSGSNKVNVGNAAVSLKYLMDTFIDTIATITVGDGSVGLSAASVAAINALKTQFATLLDKGSSTL